MTKKKIPHVTDQPKRRERIERMEKCNGLLRYIGGNGRNFFYHPQYYGQAYFSMDAAGKLWYHDEVSGERNYLYGGYLGKKFTGGGTLNGFVRSLKDYITRGLSFSARRMERWIEADTWGYGEEAMQAIYLVMLRHGIVDLSKYPDHKWRHLAALLDEEGEFYDSLDGCWDIGAIWQYFREKVEAGNTPAVGSLDVPTVARTFLNIEGATPSLFGSNIDWDYARSMDIRRLRVPIIRAETRVGSIPIDGSHRLGRAFLEGIPTLPVVHLKADELEQFNIRKLPKERVALPSSKYLHRRALERSQEIKAGIDAADDQEKQK